jgi:Protein of unknown function (DUF4031)
MIYLADKMRHLVCDPYSIEGLHQMAMDLNINKCWFHSSKKGMHHYDIPKKRLSSILADSRVKEITPKEMVQFLKSQIK